MGTAPVAPPLGMAPGQTYPPGSVPTAQGFAINTFPANAINNNNQHITHTAATLNNQPSTNTPYTHPWEDPGGGPPLQHQQINQQYQQAMSHHPWAAPTPLTAPAYHILGPPPWPPQGLTPRETDYTSRLQALAQLAPPNPSYYPTGPTQTALDPSWLQLISRTVLATVASLQQTTMMATGGNQPVNLTTTTRSAKLLNGTNKHSLLGFCGQSIQENPPEIFIILDSNKDATTKFHALEDRLTAVQRINPFINFMLQQATYTDIQKHQFHFVPHEKHMMRGFTPFCLQKMDQTNEIMLSPHGRKNVLHHLHHNERPRHTRQKPQMHTDYRCP